MSLTLKYSDPKGIDEPAALVSLGSNVRHGTLSLSQNAAAGEPAMSQVDIDDPGGIYHFRALRAFDVRETSAPSNNQVIGRFAMADRRVKREASLRLGADRRWSVDVVDYNWHLGKRVFVDDDAKRPAESAGDRLRWLLQRAAHINLNDYGHVTYPSHSMDENDYRGQRPIDLLADCAAEGGYNFWADFNEAHGRPELFFMDPNGSGYASDLRVSNYLFDYDGTTTFVPYIDAEWTSSGTRLAFGVYVQFSGGSEYVRNDAVGEQFAKLDQTAPMANIRSAARARRVATKFLNDNDEEDERIAFAIKVPAANVNDLRNGQRFLARFSHLPGHEGDWVWWRCTNRAVIQDPEDGEDQYRIYIEASLGGDGTAVAESRGTAGGVMWAPDDSLSVGVLNSWNPNWRATGDVHGPGYIDEPLDTTAFAYYLDSGYTVGYEVLAASGSLDILVQLDFIYAHTGHPDITWTCHLEVNGVSVGNQTYFSAATGSFGNVIGAFDFTTSGVAVVAGDIIRVRLACTSSVGLTIPSGTGADLAFRILNTSTVTG